MAHCARTATSTLITIVAAADALPHNQHLLRTLRRILIV